MLLSLLLFMLNDEEDDDDEVDCDVETRLAWRKPIHADEDEDDDKVVDESRLLYATLSCERVASEVDERMRPTSVETTRRALL